MTLSLKARLRRAQFWLRYKIEVAHRLRRRGRTAPETPTVAVVYIRPVGRAEYDESARRFVETYRECPPLHEHSLHVVLNGEKLSEVSDPLFSGLDVTFHQHDNSGWDIGAFQAMSKKIESDIIVCLGGNAYFKRPGWLRRMVQAFRANGDGLYGASASYERDPHIRTTAFWCDPMLLRAYPKRVVSYEDRYEFEASESSLTRLAQSVDLGCWLVTWDGECGMSEWRSPADTFRRGDQRNSLVFDRHFDVFDAADEELRAELAAVADTWDEARFGPREVDADITGSSADADGSTSADGPCAFPESEAAHYWCHGTGVEIGAAAHNPFGLNTLNIDIAESEEGKVEQIRMCGEIAPIDIIAPGDDLPLTDESQDFVISSHVLEHFPDPIAALLEWYRVVAPGGVIYMIVPHKERTFDRDRERTTLEHLIEDHESETATEEIWEHQHAWITEDVVELVEWMAASLGVKWRIGEVQDVDDKVGNGFAIALVKTGSLYSDLAPASPRPSPLAGTGWYTKELLSDSGYQIGEHSYGAPEVMSYGQDTRLRIGKYCSIALDSKVFLGGEHRADWVTTFPFPPLAADWPEAAGIAGTPTSKGDVVIGNDVWIGHGATILSGVTVSDGAVIGAMSVVTKDVPPYGIVAGNPAQVVRKRFDDETISKLLAIRWWYWADHVVADNVGGLCSDDVQSFVQAHYRKR